jgi:hypothetical protein
MVNSPNVVNKLQNTFIREMLFQYSTSGRDPWREMVVVGGGKLQGNLIFDGQGDVTSGLASSVWKLYVTLVDGGALGCRLPPWRHH